MAADAAGQDLGDGPTAGVRVGELGIGVGDGDRAHGRLRKGRAHGDLRVATGAPSGGTRKVPTK
jgi:hypothetical protein